MDERTERLLRIGSTVVAVEVGGKDARVNAAARALAQHATQAQAAFGEIDRHSQLLDSEKGRRKAEMAGPYADALKQAARVLTEEGARVAAAVKSASAVRPYGDHTPMHQLLTDFELVKLFHATTPIQRAAKIHEITRDPSAADRMTEALLRVDPALTGLSAKQHDELRWALLSHRDPALAEALATERQQVANLREAIGVATKVLTKAAPGAHMELRQNAPEVLAATQAE